MNQKKTYVCLGSDHALISQEQYEAGLKICAGVGCTMKGKPFVEGYRCNKCGETFAKGISHNCQL